MHRGECVTTGGLYGPTHLCVAHLNCTKKKFTVFSFDEVRWWWGGVHVSGGRGLHGVSEGGGVI